MMKSKLIALFLLTSAGLFSQTIDRKKMDDYLNYIGNNNLGIGSISIFKDGKEVYSKSFGQENLPDKIYNKDTKYHVGSVTKMVTATLIFKLIEEGKLNLEDKLSDFFPELPNANIITIRNLLEHSSGLGSYVVKDGEVWVTDKATRKEIFHVIQKQGTSFKPDEKVAYSNTAYYLLTDILEKKYNLPYHKIVEREITAPLALKNFASTKSNPKNVFKPYHYENNHWSDMKDILPENVIGVGDIVSTSKDLNIFNENLFHNKILKKSSMEKMIPASGKGWGRGIALWDFDGITFYGHGGDTLGSHALLIYSPEQNLSIAYNTNAERINKESFVKNIVSLLYSKEFKWPEIK
ncbi:serine hydrolase domain-containing protein [Chryseobacterium sp. Mn2064]|uniref:serine hydrolase domain-containing protein n=1 Tax=Chryseobacterium sp. Mn2064 TaxID=3395263 RepID=UPI003BE6706F